MDVSDNADNAENVKGKNLIMVLLMYAGNYIEHLRIKVIGRKT